MSITVPPALTSQQWGPATVASVAVTAVAVIAGAIVTIITPSTLSFSAYVQDLTFLVGGHGLLAIGRGLHLGLRKPPK